MTQAKAWQDLTNPEVGGHADAEGIYEMAKAAGLSKREIEEIVKERALQRLRRDLPA